MEQQLNLNSKMKLFCYDIRRVLIYNVLYLEDVKFGTIKEGLFVQMLHIGGKDVYFI
jgi:hypothetical protein